MKESTPAKPKHDVVLVHGKTADGAGLKVIRSRPERLELAELRPAPEGTPLNGRELVRLKRRAPQVPVFDVEVMHDDRPHGEAPAGSDAAPGSPPRPAHAGPARTSNPRYRSNWDRIFGSGRSGEDLPN